MLRRWREIPQARGRRAGARVAGADAACVRSRGRRSRGVDRGQAAHREKGALACLVKWNPHQIWVLSRVGSRKAKSKG